MRQYFVCGSFVKILVVSALFERKRSIKPPPKVGGGNGVFSKFGNNGKVPSSITINGLLNFNKGVCMGKKGFTLVELMVVIVIIGILAAVAIPRILAGIDRARWVGGTSSVRAVATQQEVRNVEEGTYANAIAELNLPASSGIWTLDTRNTGNLNGIAVAGGFVVTAHNADRGTISINGEGARRYTPGTNPFTGTMVTEWVTTPEPTPDP